MKRSEEVKRALEDLELAMDIMGQDSLLKTVELLQKIVEFRKNNGSLDRVHGKKSYRRRGAVYAGGGI